MNITKAELLEHNLLQIDKQNTNRREMNMYSVHFIYRCTTAETQKSIYKR